jgi:hypothetical protein
LVVVRRIYRHWVVLRQTIDRAALPAGLCYGCFIFLNLLANPAFERGSTTSNGGPNVCSATVSGTSGSFVAFPTNKNWGRKMERRDQELLDKQMRRLRPPRNNGVIVVLLATMFLVGMTLGSVLSEPKTEPMQIVSIE